MDQMPTYEKPQFSDPHFYESRLSFGATDLTKPSIFPNQRNLMTSNKFSPRDHFPISSIKANLCHYTYLQNIQLHILAYTNEFSIFCLLVQTTWNISATGYFYWDQSIRIPNNAFQFGCFWNLIKKVCIICYQYVFIQTILLLDSVHSLIPLCTFLANFCNTLHIFLLWDFRAQQRTYYWYCHYFVDCKMCKSHNFGTG